MGNIGSLTRDSGCNDNNLVQLYKYCCFGEKVVFYIVLRTFSLSDIGCDFKKKNDCFFLKDLKLDVEGEA